MTVVVLFRLVGLDFCLFTSLTQEKGGTDDLCHNQAHPESAAMTLIGRWSSLKAFIQLGRLEGHWMVDVRICSN